LNWEASSSSNQFSIFWRGSYLPRQFFIAQRSGKLNGDAIHIQVIEMSRGA
jgi:hypothetical protein